MTGVRGGAAGGAVAGVGVRRLVAIGAALVVLGALGACGGAERGGEAAPGTGLTTAAATPTSVTATDLGAPDPASGAPAVFVNRSTLPTCGVAEHQGLRPGPPSAASVRAASCLTAALGGATGAELVVKAPTVEGDTIVSYLRALPESPVVETFTDSTADKWGTRVWVSERCTGFDPRALTGTGCSARTQYVARSIVGSWMPRQVEERYGTTEGVIDRSSYTITFSAASWSGSDGCNELRGTYTVDPTGRFRGTSSGSTFIACDRIAAGNLIEDATSVELSRDLLRFMAGERILADYVPAT